MAVVAVVAVLGGGVGGGGGVVCVVYVVYVVVGADAAHFHEGSVWMLSRCCQLWEQDLGMLEVFGNFGSAKNLENLERRATIIPHI